MDKLFKIHCSQIGKIMGRIGLTDKQETYLNELIQRDKEGKKPLTDNMKRDLRELKNKKDNPELPDTCTTHLKEWYAGDRDRIHSKYLDKGNWVEQDVIDMMAIKLGLGMAHKNDEMREDEYMIGTCDVDSPEFIVDVKAPWNATTFHQALNGIDPNYEWQGRGYMRLWDKPLFYLFYGLVDTPADVNYETEVTFDHIPEDERWVAYKVTRDALIEQEIVDRVIMCRDWLEKYDTFIGSRVGRVIE